MSGINFIVLLFSSAKSTKSLSFSLEISFKEQYISSVRFSITKFFKSSTFPKTSGFCFLSEKYP